MQLTCEGVQPLRRASFKAAFEMVLPFEPSATETSLCLMKYSELGLVVLRDAAWTLRPEFELLY